MEFNFEAILKAVEKTVARVFGERIILVNISGKVSNQHSVWWSNFDPFENSKVRENEKEKTNSNFKMEK